MTQTTQQAPPPPTDEKTAKQLQEKQEAKQDLSGRCNLHIIAQIRLTVVLSVHASGCDGYPIPDVRYDGEWSRSTREPRSHDVHRLVLRISWGLESTSRSANLRKVTSEDHTQNKRKKLLRATTKRGSTPLCAVSSNWLYMSVGIDLFLHV